MFAVGRVGDNTFLELFDEMRVIDELKYHHSRLSKDGGTLTSLRLAVWLEVPGLIVTGDQ